MSKECKISSQDLEILRSYRHTERHKLIDAVLNAYFESSRNFVRILQVF
jgi:hypothetical protein